MSPTVQQQAGCVIGRDYPAPLVEHATAYREAKRRIAEIRGRAATRAEAKRVYDRHGSRLRPRPQERQRVQGDLFSSVQVPETRDQEGG